MTNAEASTERTLVVAIPFEPVGFNEVYRNYTGGGGYFVANNIFNRLVIIDIYGEEGAIKPDLAERWEVLDGGSRYRFHLRETQWHDGHPFRAEDVKETYLTAIEHGYRAAASLTDVKDVVVIDDRTVDIVLHQPNSGFLAQLAIFVWTHILPAHLYAGTDWPTNPANENPVGTGPYRFEEWRRGDAVRVVANPNYHLGRPKVDAIEFKVVPKTEDALELLRRGEVDFCTDDVPCERLDEFDGNGVEVSRLRGNALGHVTFNFNREPWSDHRVRLAVAKLIDRDELAEVVCPRAMPAPFAYLQHIEWAFDPAARYPELDVAGALALLDEAGHHPDADGVRLRGRIVSRGFLPYHTSVARHLVSVLRTAGIELTLDVLTPPEWAEQISVGRQFDLLVDGLGIGPDPVLFEEVLRSDSVLNVGSYRNDELDDLLLRAKAAQSRDERAVLYKAAQQIIASDLPRIHVVEHGHHHAHSTRWRGWSWDEAVQGSLPAWSLEQVAPAVGDD